MGLMIVSSFALAGLSRQAKEGGIIILYTALLYTVDYGGYVSAQICKRFSPMLISAIKNLIIHETSA